MHVVGREEVDAWYASAIDLAEFTRTIGHRGEDEPGPELARMPAHLRFAIVEIARAEGRVPSGRLDSIPLHSLCRGLFLPLSGIGPERAGPLFGIRTEPPPDAAAREVLLDRFLAGDLGLTVAEKLSALLGDPFRGRPGGIQRDTLIRALLSLQLVSRRTLLDRLAQVGDVAALWAESRRTLRSDPPLTAAEALEALRFLPKATPTTKLEVLRSLLERAGRMEAYFLAKLLLRKAGFGFEYQGPMLARALARRFAAPEEQVLHAMALTDAFRVVELLETEGPAALHRIRLQPLVAVQPALAGGSADEVETFPVWVERKYDGIRLMLHKSTDATGAVLAAAYTRNRGDWLELVPGLAATIRALPARLAIVDGELHGTVVDEGGVRPATVYDVYSALQGQPSRPVNLRFAAFDLIYLEGRDLTPEPLLARRRALLALVAPLAAWPLPVPIAVAEGQMATGPDDLSRFYHHFRSQGHEGIVAKDPDGPYRLAARDPTWRKRKPVLTVDLVLLGAVLAVTGKTSAGMFGSYVIGARTADGGFADVGDVAGIDRLRDAEIQAEILREGLLTGRRIERRGVSGVRPGLDLRPAIVVTIKIEGLIKDTLTGKLSLRDPKLVAIRSDKAAAEADSLETLERLHLKGRLG